MAKIRIEYDIPDGKYCERCKQLFLDIENNGNIYTMKCKLFKQKLCKDTKDYLKCDECKILMMEE